VPVRVAGGVHVVVQEPARGRVPLGGRIGGGQAAGVLADQVMEAVSAPPRLGQQVMVVQALQIPPGAGQARAGQRRSGVGVEVGAGVLAQAAEHPPLPAGEVLVGTAERGGDRQVLGVHQFQPVTRSGQVGGQVGGRPGRVVVQLAGQHPQGERQAAAQPGDLGHCRIAGVQAGPGREPGQQPGGLPGGEGVEAEGAGIVQRGQMPAAGDQYQRAGGARQQRPDLVAAGSVVQQ